MEIPGLVDFDLHASHVCALWDLSEGVALQSSNPRLRDLRGDRKKWIEAVLDIELLNSIVEQEGALITSRQCHGIVNC